ncbi:related to Rieske [2Fe-2S] domain protein [Ustilago trichophora]|uniref:Related to Rieske [2Fe-2S] domain protein n=1 Tax=Ustilago trichophora TaxID=86804 RepID=A0A5C3EGM3_9BASI|nr:related to Rieske [2Fe-2S] domain protein [Ustilago trichophora]
MAHTRSAEASTSADAINAWFQVAPVDKLASSSRHHLTLRHPDTQEYHSLLIFSFPAPTSKSSSQSENEAAVPSTSAVPSHDTYYCMEATCPHLGAPLENATLEANDVEFDDDFEDMVVVCPWHEYDFSLSTGESSHGISACVYKCSVRNNTLFIEAPKPSNLSADQDPHSASSKWELIELRPVSESSPSVSSRQDAAHSLHLQASQLSLSSDSTKHDASESPTTNDSASKDVADTESLAPPSPLPKTLVEWAVLVLNTSDPVKKVAYTRLAAKAFRSGECKVIGGGRWNTSDAFAGRREWIVKPQESAPERPPRMKEEVRVRPGQEGKRGRGGTEKSRIAILHSLANIEQWAIDLAWDIIARAPRLCAQFFAGDNEDAPTQKMPMQFFSDFVKVAEDEAKHFSLLTKRLEEMGSYFGALPVHHGLWDSAMETAHSLTARLSIIHLVHEARGLDVNPTTIKKFDNAGDKESVETLTVIHLDEITHVSAGHRWMTWLCSNARPQLDPVQVFRQEVRRNFIGRLKGPFNAEDRRKAGLDKEWYDDLVGEKESTYSMGVRRNEVPGG